MDTPIACSLSPLEMVDRKAWIAAIADGALRKRERVDGGARFTFAAGEDTERQLREVIAAEAKCCAFLSFDLERVGDDFVLAVTGPPEAEAVIAELFEQQSPAG